MNNVTSTLSQIFTLTPTKLDAVGRVSTLTFAVSAWASVMLIGPYALSNKDPKTKKSIEFYAKITFAIGTLSLISSISSAALLGFNKIGMIKFN